MQFQDDGVVATARAFPNPSLDYMVMTKIKESYMDGRGMLAEGAAAAGPAAGAEDPTGAQPADKKKGGRMASGSGFTWKELKGSFSAPTPL